MLHYFVKDGKVVNAYEEILMAVMLCVKHMKLSHTHTHMNESFSFFLVNN
jgi:hypothetical protein